VADASESEGDEAVLVLSRRTRDSIMIGHDIVVTVLAIGRDQVRLGIVAPPDVEVHREEVYRSIQQANRGAAAAGDVSQLAGVVRGVGPTTDSTEQPAAGCEGSDPGTDHDAARSTAGGSGTATP